jgi:hypothetical protein
MNNFSKCEDLRTIDQSHVTVLPRFSFETASLQRLRRRIFPYLRNYEASIRSPALCKLLGEAAQTARAIES